MKTGFATSACAAAAAVAAVSALERKYFADSEVTILLPSGVTAVFQIRTLEQTVDEVLCGVIKDAGDDPDVTNGIEIQASVRRNSLPENRIFGGTGVGIVTLPGLPVAVGKPAINPGSQKLIHTVLNRFLRESGIRPGFDLTIIVPEGEAVAQRTMNPKLGIQGGISILGTDGIVHPYSVPAFRASIYTEMKVAAENGYTGIAAATGKRSEFPLNQLHRFRFSKVILSGMIGKMTKVAQGRFHTHVEQGRVDFSFLSELARAKGIPADLCQAILSANTARQVQGWLSKIDVRLEPEIARLAAVETRKKVGPQYTVAVAIFSLEGELLGFSEIGGEK